VEISLCVISSIVVSIIITKILATHYFEIVDGYVKDVVDDVKKTMVEIVSGQGKL